MTPTSETRRVVMLVTIHAVAAVAITPTGLPLSRFTYAGIWFASLITGTIAWLIRRTHHAPQILAAVNIVIWANALVLPASLNQRPSGVPRKGPEPKRDWKQDAKTATPQRPRTMAGPLVDLENRSFGDR
jgi:hypothetical protein